MKVRDSDVLAWVRGQRKISTGRVWAAGFHRVTACYRSAGVLKIYGLCISLIFQFLFLGRGKRRITESADSESVDTGARQ
jgi:hypothetical protein